MLFGDSMKKKILATILLVLLTASSALADVLEDFRQTYISAGIDKAVTGSLKQGVGPVAIVEFGLYMEGMEFEDLIRAMYCAGIKGKDIKSAAILFQIPDTVVTAGYKRSVNECLGRIVNNDSYGETAPVSFDGPPDPDAGEQVSPDRF